MTISSSTRKAGPFAGDDLTTEFAFAFKVFSDSDLYVVRAVASTGAETVLTLATDYTVTLNADQNNNPGGTVTLLSALASGYTLTLTSSLGYLQPTDLTNQGGFYPQVITTALDRLTILSQQLKEKLDRAAVVPISGTVTADELTGYLIALADDLANIDTVAGISANVTTVAGISADVTTAATNSEDISNFAGVYYGPSATEPATRKDGSALQEGDLYFDTATNRQRVRSGSLGWVDNAVPVTITTQTFDGTGAQVDFTLSDAPPFLNAVEAAVSGVLLVPGVDYTLSGTTLSFTVAPASGTGNVFVRWYSAYSGGVPNDGSVTTAKLVDDAVTHPKLGSGAIVQIVDATPYTDWLSTSSPISVGSIPTISQGSQILLQSFTPVYANSRIRIEITVDALCTSVDLVPAAVVLFQNGVSEALCGALSNGGAESPFSVGMRCELDAVTTDTRSYLVKVGLAIPSGTLYVNGNSSTSVQLGTSHGAKMTITEIKA